MRETLGLRKGSEARLYGMDKFLFLAMKLQRGGARAHLTPPPP
jgi:hypothetical protein